MNSDPSMGTSYVITGLERLTRYTVFVHATNSDGTGMNSPAEILTTSATGQHLDEMLGSVCVCVCVCVCGETFREQIVLHRKGVFSQQSRNTE